MTASTLGSNEEQEALASHLDLLVAEASARTDAFEARVELSESMVSSWAEGRFQSFDESRLAGLCIRVWEDDAAGFASTHSSDRAAIGSLVDEALDIARANVRTGRETARYAPQGSASLRYEPELAGDPFRLDTTEVASLLRRTEEAILEEDPEAYARTRFAASSRRILFEDAAGRRLENRFFLSTLEAGAVHRSADRPGECLLTLAGERGVGDFEGERGPEELAREAAQRAEEAAHAKPAPPGRQRVLSDPLLSGLLAHESFGHLTEHDLVSMGWSRLQERMGERFADEQVSVVDAPSPPSEGLDGIQLPYDEEGTQGEPVTILEDGVLRRWMHTRGSAPASDQAPTGNARALNARFPPIVRMRNTYFEAGDHSLDEMLELLGNGVYLMAGRGGSPASDGSFMFTATRGYVVENGEIQHPIRATSVSGNILDFLEGVEAVGSELGFRTSNFGGCGKWAQSYIPVGMGGPHVLVDEALVGGRR